MFSVSETQLSFGLSAGSIITLGLSKDTFDTFLSHRFYLEHSRSSS